MKTIFKVLGVAASIYLSAGIGWLIGVIDCDDCYNDRIVKREGNVEAAIDLNDLLISEGLKKNKRKMKRSEVLSMCAKRWSKAGYTQEEIKQGLDNLREKLD